MNRRTRRSRKLRTTTVPEILESRQLLTTFTVDSLADTVADDGKLTLREAVHLANKHSGEDVILFAIDGRIKLTNGSLPIRDAVTIRGRGPDSTSIDGLEQHTILNVSRASLTVEDIKLRNGRSTDRGGAIRMGGRHRLTVDNVHFIDNDGGARGGAISTANAAVDISGSLFRGNTASHRGGAISPTLGMRAVITDSVFENNSAGLYGGALSGEPDDDALGLPKTRYALSGTTFVGNSAHQGGAISDVAELSVVSSVFRNNEATGAYAGAIDADNVTEFHNSAVVGNRAQQGHSAITAESLTMTNSSVLENITAGKHAVRAAGFTVANSTIAGNIQSAGFAVSSLGLNASSTIIAGNLTDGQHGDVGVDGLIAVSTSLIGSNAGTELDPTGPTPDADGNLIGSAADPIDPKLMPAGNYGTTTWFSPPGTDSPALDRGSNPEDLAHDQRGADRSRGAAVDMGAYEGSITAALRVTGGTITEGTGGTKKLKFRVHLTGNVDGPFTAALITEDGTAKKDDNDYKQQTATPEFTGVHGETKIVSVVVKSDGREEIDETLTVRLVAVSNTTVQLSNRTALGRIVNDDQNDGIVFFNGILNIRATDGDDEISVEKKENGKYIARLNDQSRTVTDVDAVQVIARNGHDLIRMINIGVAAKLKGGAGNDTIYGGALNDTILGGSGDDDLRGGRGGDWLTGGNGNDVIRGQGDNDLLDGDAGDDTLYAGSGRDQANGGAGSDLIEGGSDDDRLYGFRPGGASAADRDDTITGGGGRDSLYGNNGNDVLFGNDGKDWLRGEGHNDSIYGGAGNDWIGGDGHGDDFVAAGAGNDHIGDDRGNNTLIGGAGHDAILAGGGNDEIRGGDGRDSVWAGRGRDTILAGSGDDFVRGGDGPDRIEGGNGIDYLIGERGKDTLFGGNQADILHGGTTRQDVRPTVRALNAAWKTAESYDAAVSEIRRIFPGLDWVSSNGGVQEAEDDGHVDSLVGGGGADFFYAAAGTAADDLFGLEGRERNERV